MEGTELAKQAKENLEQVYKLSDKQRELNKARDSEIYRLKWDVYEPKIRAIQEERENAIRSTMEQFKQQIDLAENESKSLCGAVETTRRIIKFLQLQPKDITIPLDELKHRGYKQEYKEFLGYLIDDEYLKIALLILDNDKPKNKYSLVAIGKCLFFDNYEHPLLNLNSLRHYISEWYISSITLDVELSIKDFPTAEEARQFYTKRSNVLLIDYLAEYQRVKAEYLEVIKLYKLEDFAEFIAFEAQKR